VEKFDYLMRNTGIIFFVHFIFCFLKGQPVNPKNGVWRMDGQHFRKSLGNGIENWALLIKDGRTREDEIR